MKAIKAFDVLGEKAKNEFEQIVGLSKFFLKKDHLVNVLKSSMPSLSIETTNICNANCTFCGYQYQSRPRGIMSSTLFEKILRDFSDCGGGDLSLTPTVGDPLVDPDLLDRIRAARLLPNITGIGLYTNLISLHRIGAKPLIESGVTSISVSTSGFDEEMYKRIYRSKEYNRVISNIKNLATVNNQAGRPVTLSIALRVDRPRAEVMDTPEYKIISDLIGAENISFAFFFDDWSGRINPDDLTGDMKLRGATLAHRLIFSLRRPKISACSEMFSGPIVYWDGKVGACGCRDVDAKELIIGDANTEHLGDIWFGEKIKEMRDRFISGKIPEICRNCYHYNNISIYLRPDRQKLMESIRRSPMSRTTA
jgi:MoaA/NifB/PqqE/SkfB family radical SAM enzyme